VRAQSRFCHHCLAAVTPGAGRLGLVLSRRSIDPEAGFDVIETGREAVARVAEGEKAFGRRRANGDAKASVARTMSGPRTQDLRTHNVAAKGVRPCAKGAQGTRPPRRNRSRRPTQNPPYQAFLRANGQAWKNGG